MKTSKQQIGELIQEYRLKKGLTQLELATLLGYNTSMFISLMENGQSNTPHKTIGKLIVLLGIPEKLVVKIFISAFEESLNEQIKEGKRLAR